MIAFFEISKSFGRRDVLTRVTYAARAGAVTALVGPNGSGKTTLIKLLLGLAGTDRGIVLVDGKPTEPDGEYRRDIGYMPQYANFPVNLRVRDVFDVVTALRPGASTDCELIDAFHLRAHWDAPIGTLSGGTRQKVNAAVAFLFSPRLLVLDEPSAGLDPVASQILKRKILRARDAGCTVLITSHIMSELEALTDDVMFICDGSLLFTGPARELLKRTGESSLEAAIAAMMQSAGTVATRLTDTGLTLSLVAGARK